MGKRFMEIDYVDGKILIYSSIDYKDDIKTLSYRKWNPTKYCWETTPDNLRELITKFPEAKARPSLVEYIQKRKALQKASFSMKNIEEYDLGDFGRGKTMYPFQKAGLEFVLKTNCKAMIADDMGTGKSCQSLSYLQINPTLRPAIIVCPASVKYTWEDETERWLTTKENVVVIDDNKTDISEATIVIINYDRLKKNFDKLDSIKAKVIIFDECHNLKNPRAAKTITSKELAKPISKRLGLTGTPQMNKPIELFSQLNIINPEKYPDDSFFSFAKKYCDAHETEFGWDFSGASNLEELALELREVMIRRTKAQVLKELPPKTRKRVRIKLSNMREYKKIYKEIRKEKISKDRAGLYEAMNQLEVLKQLCMVGKFEGAKQWVSEFIETGEKLVLFCIHTDAIDFFMENFKDKAVRLDGSTSAKDRKIAVDRFQNDDSVMLFVGNIKAAGVGLTLTAASNVAFFELDWTPALHEQAEDRCNRIGQEYPVTCYYLLAGQSIEFGILNMLESKRETISKTLIDDDEHTFRLMEYPEVSSERLLKFVLTD